MARNSNSSPKYEYSKVDCTVVLKRDSDGDELPCADRFEKFTIDPKGESGIVDGSGPFPRAHTATKFKPEGTLQADADFIDYMYAWLADGTCTVTLQRQRPGDAPITSTLGFWKPIPGEHTADNEAMLPEAKGNALRWEPDTTNKIKRPTA